MKRHPYLREISRANLHEMQIFPNRQRLTDFKHTVCWQTLTVSEKIIRPGKSEKPCLHVDGFRGLHSRFPISQLSSIPTDRSRIFLLLEESPGSVNLHLPPANLNHLVTLRSSAPIWGRFQEGGEVSAPGKEEEEEAGDQTRLFYETTPCVVGPLP